MFSLVGRAAAYPARPMAPPINIMITELLKYNRYNVYIIGTSGLKNMSITTYKH